MQLLGGVDGRGGKERSHSEAAMEQTHSQRNPKVNVSIKSYINAHHVPEHREPSQGWRLALQGGLVILQLAFWESLLKHVAVYYHGGTHCREQFIQPLPEHLYCRDAAMLRSCSCERLPAGGSFQASTLCADSLPAIHSPRPTPVPPL